MSFAAECNIECYVHRLKIVRMLSCFFFVLGWFVLFFLGFFWQEEGGREEEKQPRYKELKAEEMSG